MLKLMIVDDEEEIRNGIKNVIDWETHGITVCCEAANGKEALKGIEGNSPDILLLDIRMPVMDGLSLLEAINKKGLSIRSVILSGYDDFSYAQKALKQGASDYLLKPCRPEEILQTVLKVKSAIESENSRRTTFARLKSEFERYLPAIKERFLTRLINAEGAWGEKSPGLSELFELNIKNESLMVILFRIDDYAALSDQNSNKDVELMKFAVRNIAGELLSARFYCEVFEYENDIIALLNTRDIVYEKHLLPVLDEIKASIRRYLEFTVSIGMGKSCDDIGGLGASYSEALKSLESRFFLGNNETIRYEDVHRNALIDNNYPAEEEKAILRCLKTGSRTELEARCAAFFTAADSGKATRDHLLKFGQALVFSLYHLCIELNVETEEVFGKNFAVLDAIQKLDTFTQLKSRLMQLVLSVFERVEAKKGANRTIELALNYIDKNYNTELSLETVAGKVYITPGYLSLLFKQVTGVNFVEYLHRTRIEKACEMLRCTGLKTYEVAYRVGYGDEKYFSQIFKKYAGMTPSQYREASGQSFL